MVFNTSLHQAFRLSCVLFRNIALRKRQLDTSALPLMTRKLGTLVKLASKSSIYRASDVGVPLTWNCCWRPAAAAAAAALAGL